jgi:hypothetical protein
MINEAPGFDRRMRMTGVIMRSCSSDQTTGAKHKKGADKMEQRIDTDCVERRQSSFRHLLPFLAIPLAFGIIRGMRRHKYAYIGAQEREAWESGVPPIFAELHRRAHAADTQKPAETQA